MTYKRINRKKVHIIIKRRYVGTLSMQQVFSDVLTRALIRMAA